MDSEKLESPASDAANPSADSAADRLLASHSQATANPVKRGRGRPPGSKTRKPDDTPAPAPATAGYLPPQTSLTEVMASGTGLFYSALASLYDDEDWLLSDTVKKEMGNVLSWMLADDFYKMGGIGKYVTGSILFLSVFTIQAAKTAKNRRARKLEEAAKRNRGSNLPGPGKTPANNPVQGVENATMAQRTMAGFVAGPPQEPPTV